MEKNFGYEDDYVIESLEKNMEELRKSKLLDLGPSPENELPKKPFGKALISVYVFGYHMLLI